MDIKGLDKIKNLDNNDKEEIRVTGLDFNKKPEPEVQETEQSFDFIKLEHDPSVEKDHGVTGLDFINNKNQPSETSHGVTGLDFISREGEGENTSSSPEGLDSIKQLNFSDMGIIRHDEG